MALITPATFFAHNHKQQQDYARVYAARKIAPGDGMKTATGETRAIAAGWEVSVYGEGGQGQRRFIADVIFDETATAAADLPAALPKIEMSHSELQRYSAVARGDNVRLSAALAIDGGAPYDGFLLACSGTMPIYQTNYEVTSTFNKFAGRQLVTQEEQLVRMTGEPLLRGIVLREDTRFQVKSGSVLAKAGSIIYRDEKADDGFTIEGPAFTRMGLSLATPVFEVSTSLKAPMVVFKTPVKFKRINF